MSITTEEGDKSPILVHFTNRSQLARCLTTGKFGRIQRERKLLKGFEGILLCRCCWNSHLRLRVMLGKCSRRKMDVSSVR